MAVIAIDFDNTLIPVSGETPYAGAKDAINLLREQGHKIIIHSCNNPKYIQKVLNNADIRYDLIWENHGKPIADLYLDDKGCHFQGDWASTYVEMTDRLEGLDNRKAHFHGL